MACVKTHKETIILDDITCNGVKWDCKDSEFVKSLDRDLNQYKQQLELILEGLSIDAKQAELSDELYLLKLEEDLKGKERLQSIVSKASGQEIDLDLKGVDRAKILKKNQELNIAKQEFKRKRLALQSQKFKA